MGRLKRVMGTNIIHLPHDEEIRLGHTWYEVEQIDNIIMAEKPEWFVEVGIHEGGLSYLLIPEYQWMNYMGIELYSDLIQQPVKDLYKKFQKSLMIADCFSETILELVATLPGKKIVYCDGGNKVGELVAYKHTCQSGDLIFAHDYHDGVRKVKEIPFKEINHEVVPLDVLHLDNDPTFERYNEGMLSETRIIGWRKL